jgi:4-amino-4-deoxy-L-arabinose transferase-like glycosyltransferase
MKLWLGVLIFLIMTLPWFIGLWQQGRAEYFSEFFIRNHLQRFFSDNLAGVLSDSAPSHHRPFYYYLTEFPNGFLPWSVLLIPVFFYVFSKSARSDGADILSEKGILFAKCWFFAGIIFLSAASTKRTLYIMPVFAPIGMLTAAYIESTLGPLRPITKIGKVFIWIFALIILFLGLGLTPISLSVKKVYFADVSVPFMAPVIILSVFVTVLCCLAMRYLWKRNLKEYWISMNAAVILMLLFALTVAMPVVDVHNSFVPFCRQVAAAVPAGESLHAYRPNETIRGVVPFYTGRYIIEVNELSDMETMFRKEEPFYIIIRDKQERMEKKLLSTGKVFPLVKHELTGTDHALVLFSNKPAQKQ